MSVAQKHHHPFYTPLSIVSNSAVRMCTQLFDVAGKAFMDPKLDDTIRAEAAEKAAAKHS